MAFGSPGKRKATAPANPAKRQKLLEVIQEALLATDGFPKEVRQMVSGNLEDCLGIPKEERHPTQEKVIGMVGEMLSCSRDVFQKTIDDAESKLGSAVDEKAFRQKAHEAQAALVTNKTEAVAAAKAAVNESTQALKAAKGALSTAEAEQAAGDKDLVSASATKAKLEEAFRDSFTPLREGEVQGKEQRVASLILLSQEFDLDSSMIKSLPSALGKSVEERGTFDVMVFDTLADNLTKRIQPLEETLAQAEPARAERAEKVESAQKDLADKEAAAETCKNDLEQAKSELEDAKTHHKEAANTLQQFGAEMKQAEKDLTTAQRELASFLDGAMSNYEAMVKFTNMTPVVKATVTTTSEAAASSSQ